jgi:hypothetical protein
MPKRSERDRFQYAFDGNPYEDVPPLEAYSRIQWNREPEEVWQLEAPEPLVALGDVAGFDWGGDRLELWEDGPSAPYLAVGRDSNLLYVLPKTRGAPPKRVPKFNPKSAAWQKVGPVYQTDYYSNKGDEAGYYYHQHEPPYPTMWIHNSGCRVMVPAKHRGGRSYVVADEGIIG